MSPISSTSEASVQVDLRKENKEITSENLMKEAIEKSSVSRKDFTLDEKQSINSKM